LPYYVVGKDMDKNEVYVTTNLNDESLWQPRLELTSAHWINQTPEAGEYQVRVRHRGTLVSTQLILNENGSVQLALGNAERAVAAGQSVVIYDGDLCVGGGIIA